jgi:hypothetical protein
MTCEICGSPDSLVHHITYKPPLTIHLCRKHHFMVHFKLYVPQGKTVTVYAGYEQIPITWTDDILLKTERQYDKLPLHRTRDRTRVGCVKITFTIEEELLEALTKHVERFYISFEELVRDALREWLEKKQQP